MFSMNYSINKFYVRLKRFLSHIWGSPATTTMSKTQGTFGSISEEVLSRWTWEGALLQSSAHMIGNSHPACVLFPDLRPVQFSPGNQLTVANVSRISGNVRLSRRGHLISFQAQLCLWPGFLCVFTGILAHFPYSKNPKCLFVTREAEAFIPWLVFPYFECNYVCPSAAALTSDALPPLGQAQAKGT